MSDTNPSVWHRIECLAPNPSVWHRIRVSDTAKSEYAGRFRRSSALRVNFEYTAGFEANCLGLVFS
ncbi:MAG: hypothetical protein LBG87_01860 [Spirochaetaceae bacterium]|nr:hypothetical protein [Spirochaetaceae bacterium]